MTEGGSILTLTYYGSTKVFPNYNVMGVAKAALEATVRYLAASLGPKNIRVNAISAGPIKTLAARGIGDFTKSSPPSKQRAPLHRNVDQLEVGNTAVFLSSPLACGITGEITFVDCGYNITGLCNFSVAVFQPSRHPGTRKGRTKSRPLECSSPFTPFAVAGCSPPSALPATAP